MEIKANRMIITKKLKVIPDGDKEEVKRVYKYIRDAQYNQYRYMNRLMSNVCMIYYKYDMDITNPNLKEEMKELYRVSNAAWIKEDNPIGSGMQATATSRVKQDFSTALKNGLAKGERRLPQYKRDFPFLMNGTAIKPFIKNVTYTDTNSGEDKIRTEYHLKWVNKISFRIWLPTNAYKDLNIQTIIAALNAVIENKEGYKICGSSIRVEEKYIFIFLTLDVPSKKTSYTPVTGRTMGVALGYDSPLVCCITENDKDSKFFAVGENLDFVENRKKRHEKYRQIQSAAKECHGGNGRKRKMERLNAAKNNESNYRKDINHKLSKEVIDLATKNKVANIIIESTTADELKTVPDMLRNWSYYDLVAKITYKGNMYGILTEEMKKTEKKSTKKIKRADCCPACGEVFASGNANALTPEDYWNTSTEFVCPSCGTVEEYGKVRAFSSACKAMLPEEKVKNNKTE